MMDDFFSIVFIVLGLLLVLTWCVVPEKSNAMFFCPLKFSYVFNSFMCDIYFLFQAILLNIDGLGAKKKKLKRENKTMSKVIIAASLTPVYNGLYTRHNKNIII